MKRNLGAYFELLRIKDWRGYFFIATLGFLISKGFLFPLKEIIIFYAIVFLFLSFGFLVNDCFDIKEDKLDKSKKNHLILQNINSKRRLIFPIFLGILGLSLSTLFGQKAFLLSLIAVILGFFYSVPPIRLKSRPILDLLSHGLFAGVMIFLFPIVVFSEQLSLLHFLVTLSIFYFSIILELRNHIEDYLTDKKAGLKTTVCALGLLNSEKLLRCLAFFYPFTFFPIFSLINDFNSGKYPLLFLFLTLSFLFLFLFKKDYQIVKNYKVLDIYANLSFVLLVILMIR